MAPSAVPIDALPAPQAKQVAPRTEDQMEEKTALQAISQGVCLPGIPLFSDYDKHRAWMLSHMAGAFRRAPQRSAMLVTNRAIQVSLRGKASPRACRGISRSETLASKITSVVDSHVLTKSFRASAHLLDEPARQAFRDLEGI